MMAMKDNDQWPRGSPDDLQDEDHHWLHSDFRNVALCYVRNMYAKMIDIENLDD